MMDNFRNNTIFKGDNIFMLEFKMEFWFGSIEKAALRTNCTVAHFKGLDLMDHLRFVFKLHTKLRTHFVQIFLKGLFLSSKS